MRAFWRVGVVFQLLAIFWVAVWVNSGAREINDWHARQAVLALYTDPSQEDLFQGTVSSLGGDPELFRMPVEQIFEWFYSENWQERCRAASAFGTARLGYSLFNPERVMPFLLHGLEDSNPYVRYASAYALGAMGKKARPAGPALIQIMRADPVGIVRRAAAVALEKILKPSLRA